MWKTGWSGKSEEVAEAVEHYIRDLDDRPYP